MAQQNINVGAAADDGTGDPIRTAFQKCEANFTELYGMSGGPAAVTNDANAAYTLLAADKSKYRRMTNAAAKTITVQDDATEPQTLGDEWHFRNVGAADLTFAPDAGVTINAPAGGSLVVPQGGTVTLKNVDVDEFDLLGVTSP